MLFDCKAPLLRLLLGGRSGKIVGILSERNHPQCSKKRFTVTLRWHRSARIVRNSARSHADAGEDNADEYQKALRTLDSHFTAQLNEPYERHVFRNLKQGEGETVDQFITRLRRQAENCNWDNAGEPIRD